MIDVWWDFDEMQITFKVITGSSGHAFWGGEESMALYWGEKNLSQKARSWSLPWEILFAR